MRTTDLDGHGAYVVKPEAPEVARSLNSQRDGYNDGSDQTYVVPALTSKMAKGTGGPAGDECQNLVRTFNVTPEGGQGADLRATETDTSLCLSSLNGQAHDRVTLAVEDPRAFNSYQRTEGEVTTPIRAGSQEGVGVRLSAGVRRLTPTECERLQGLPDGWTLPGADSKRYAGLGDAVTANVAEWIGRRLER